ncbi:hypothetical protein GCM10023238_03910 [Streptomyces heliomycini]
MAEATRLGRPLGVVCAVMSAAYALSASRTTARTPLRPLVVRGCCWWPAARQATPADGRRRGQAGRADNSAALRRLGAATGTLRRAARFARARLLALFRLLTLVVAELSRGRWPVMRGPRGTLGRKNPAGR